MSKLSWLSVSQPSWPSTVEVLLERGVLPGHDGIAVVLARRTHFSTVSAPVFVLAKPSPTYKVADQEVGDPVVAFAVVVLLVGRDLLPRQ